MSGFEEECEFPDCSCHEEHSVDNLKRLLRRAHNWVQDPELRAEISRVVPLPKRDLEPNTSMEAPNPKVDPWFGHPHSPLYYQNRGGIKQ